MNILIIIVGLLCAAYFCKLGFGSDWLLMFIGTALLALGLYFIPMITLGAAVVLGIVVKHI